MSRNRIAVTINSTERIEELISSPKSMKNAPQRRTVVHTYYDQRMFVYQLSDDLRFEIFTKVPLRFPQNYSIGLLLGNYNLIRVNGFHGPANSGRFVTDHHRYPHSHVLSMADINNDRSDKPSHFENLEGEFLDFNSALYYFFCRCNIAGFHQHFPDILQVPLGKGSSQ